MIFANRHHLFPAIARAGSWVTHIDTKVWWARHAIAGYQAVGFHEETDPETIAQHLRAPVGHPEATKLCIVPRLRLIHFGGAAEHVPALGIIRGQACRSQKQLAAFLSFAHACEDIDDPDAAERHTRFGPKTGRTRMGSARNC